MKTVNIHEAKTHLSRLISAAMAGEPFVIAKSGKPLVKVEALLGKSVKPSRFGFMKGQIKIPDDFDKMGSTDIVNMFDGAS